MRIPVLFFLLIMALPAPLVAADGAPVRIATYNIAMGLEAAGEMKAALESGNDARLEGVARVLQRVRPDIVLLSEFDYDPSVDAAALFNENYLSKGQKPIRYEFHFLGPVNTGIDSGLDLDGDGETGGPGDAWGFGHFPGQYGMLVLSRFPLSIDSARTFQHFRWSAMPNAQRPVLPNGTPFYPESTWNRLRLSSKSHWDLPIELDGVELHLLASHPTPPVFDGEEDRNGRRNHDEIRFWRDYTDPTGVDWIVDDGGAIGSLENNKRFIIAGDLNADPHDGDSRAGAISQLLDAPWVDASCVPSSTGAAEASRDQGGVNARHKGDPAHDTADFNDRYTGNLRIDYLLPSAGLNVLRCGVYWPAAGLLDDDPSGVSDHRLVWMDLEL
jgi:endonuclease/exonuclease/phosphatase family metal-dependent hydrolase